MIRWALSLPFKLFFALLRLLTAPKIKRSRNAEDAAAIYIQNLEDIHGTVHIPLAQTSYATAIAQAKKDLRFMVAILTSEVHDDTPGMYDVMCDDGLRAFTIDNDILVWAGNVAEPEAFAVSNALGVTRYPFIGVIVYNTLRGSQMTCVSKIEGLVTAADLVSTISDALDKYGPTLVSLRADRREQTASREIRAEQDSAYQQSLRRDRERAEEARREREEAELTAREAAQRTENVERWRMWKQSTLPEEPKASKDVSRISFRMPDGSRVIRKFLASTTIEDIYAWVDLHLHPVDGTIDTPPVGYTHKYNFTLAVPIPREVLQPTSDAVSDHKQVFPSGSLIVEILDEDE